MSTSAIDLSALWPQLESLLETQSSTFVASHGPDVILLGEDVVKAILATAVSDHFSKLVTPSADAGIDELLADEAITAQRTAAFDLVATAEAEHAAEVAALKAEAIKVAEAIGTTLISVVGGAVIKTALGGL
jgi:hypothetical protein